MTFKDHDYYIRQVIERAMRNVEQGGRPFSCLIVNNKTGEIIAAAANQVAQTGNPTSHAEIVAIAQASQILRKRNEPVDGENGAPGEDMKNHNFYILTNPCAMCAGAMAYCGADAVIHATTRSEYSKYYRDDRRHVDMDTFGAASKILCSKLNVQHYTDASESAIKVYQRWQALNA